MEHSGPSRSIRESALERAFVDAFRRGGWQVIPQPHVAGARPDLLVRRGHRQYVVDLKSSPEPRRDRVVPLFAQAILQAKAAAAKADLSPRALPLAVIGAAHLSESLIDELRSFAAKVARDVSIGIIDLEGSRIFIGDDIEGLSRLVPQAKRSQHFRHLGPQPNLFSDLNQWMLKVLLAPRIPPHLLHAPRENISSVADLARAAHVSLMSASRCVNLLRAEGFIDDSQGLNFVNIESLWDRWRALGRKPIREVPMRWIIPGQPEHQLSAALRAYVQKLQPQISPGRGRRVHQLLRPRVCLGLFAAADALGFKFVGGVAPHLYLEKMDASAIESLGLIPAHPGQRADVLIRVPSLRESIFRGAVMRHEIPVSDVLQVWLDVADHPARGASQAQQIWRRVLVPASRGLSG